MRPARAITTASSAARRDDVVLVSALTGEGVDTLRAAASARLTAANRVRHVDLDSADGAALAWLHAHGEVLASTAGDARLSIDVRLSDADWRRFNARCAAKAS